MIDVHYSPIIFSTEMVEAIFRKEKSQTRRPVTAQRSYFNGDSVPMDVWATLDWSTAWVDPGPSPAGNPGPYLKAHHDAYGEQLMARIYPRVQPGTRLWVRETWWWDGKDESTLVYKAGSDHVLPGGQRWKSSLHLPRWACRLYLDVVRVRVERLHEITASDAWAEGVTMDDALDCDGPVEAFSVLWEKINGKKGHGWDTNPWLYVYEFRMPERCRKCEEDMVTRQVSMGEGASAWAVECPSCGMQRTVGR
ncbi:MAG TPA: hypothetical protein VM537_34385 [Anaerolineae bacterium]|nr:hypothetical protein [Anaerolineae bacterium]